MIKKIELLGTSIDNYSVRESMLLVETYLNNSVMNTIETISMRMLVMAAQDPKLKAVIEALDLAMPGEGDILQAAGIRSVQRAKEIKDNIFFMEFSKRIIRNRKKVYLLGSTENKIAMLREYIEEHYGKMEIVGEGALENCVGDVAGIINEINISAPDVIFSVLPSPLQEEFLAEQIGKLNAKLWYGIGDNYTKRTGMSKIEDTVRKLMSKVIFKSKLTRYNNEK